MKINKIIFLVLLCVVSIFIFTNKSYADDFKDGDKVMFEKASYHYDYTNMAGQLSWHRNYEEESEHKPGIKVNSIGVFRDWNLLADEVRKKNKDRTKLWTDGIPFWYEQSGQSNGVGVTFPEYLPAQTDESLCAVQFTGDITAEGKVKVYDYIVIVKKVNLTKLIWPNVGERIVYKSTKLYLIDYYGDKIYENDKVKAEVFKKIQNGQQNAFEGLDNVQLQKAYLHFELFKIDCIKDILDKEKIETAMDRQRFESWATEDEKQVIQMLEGTLKNIKNLGEKRGLNFSDIPPELQEQVKKEHKEYLEESGETIRDQEIIDATNSNTGNHDDGIYHQPDKKDPVFTAGTTIDSLIGKAEEFIESAKDGAIGSVEAVELQNFSKVLYNILLSVGVAAAVIVGAILGIKIMTAGVEEKAEVEELLIPYVVACVIIFGGFGIWKLVVEILSGV